MAKNNDYKKNNDILDSTDSNTETNTLKVIPNNAEEEVSAVIPPKQSTPANNFTSNSEIPNISIERDTAEEFYIPAAKPTYKYTKQELERDKAPIYNFRYEVTGNTGAKILSRTIYSPCTIILSMDEVFELVSQGFSLFWKHAAYKGTYWFGRTINASTIKAVAFFIREELNSKKLKNNLDGSSEYYF